MRTVGSDDIHLVGSCDEIQIEDVIGVRFVVDNPDLHSVGEVAVAGVQNHAGLRGQAKGGLTALGVQRGCWCRPD